MGTEMAPAAVDLVQRSLLLALELSLPILLSGLLVGFLVSLLQAVTQIQEQTLSFVPRVLAAAAAVFLTLPWALNALAEHARESFLSMRVVLFP